MMIPAIIPRQPMILSIFVIVKLKFSVAKLPITSNLLDRLNAVVLFSVHQRFGQDACTNILKK